MDRNELIKALGAAFAEGNDKNANRVQIEETVAGEKNVLRVTNIRDNNPQFELLRVHPDAYMVENLVGELLDSGDREAERTGQQLKQKFDALVQVKETDKIESVIRTSKELLSKMRGVGKQSPQRALVYMLVSDFVAKI